MSAAPDFPSSHLSDDHQRATAAGEQAADQAIPDPNPRPPSSGRPYSTLGDHGCLDAQTDHVAEGAPSTASDQTILDKGHSSPVAGSGLTPIGDHRSCDDHPSLVSDGPFLADGLLTAFADALDDMERTRVANENRLRQLTRTEVDSDGLERGFGLDENNPQVRTMQSVVDGLNALESSTTLALKRAVKAHPLGVWARSRKGIGDKQFARMLASVGDPYWNTLHDRPRRVSELWSYCGFSVIPSGHTYVESHDAYAAGDSSSHTADHVESQISPIGGVAPARRRGQKVTWNVTARMRVWLIASKCVMFDGEYRAVYDDGRYRYANAVHQAECVRCGPAGRPAQAGSALSDGHKHARAVRLVAKEILRDLWIESRRLHEATA